MIAKNGVALAALLLASAIALAADTAADRETPAASTQISNESVWQFGRREKVCAAWTDGCRNCLRSGPNEFSCSNIGIACQPKDIRCTSLTSKTPQ